MATTGLDLIAADGDGRYESVEHCFLWRAFQASLFSGDAPCLRYAVSHTAMRAPRRDFFVAPAVDRDTTTALDAALDSLGKARGLARRGDPGVTLRLLVSLAAAAEQRLPDAVATARTEGYSWAEIGDLLGVTRASAWQRFAVPAATPPSARRSRGRG